MLTLTSTETRARALRTAAALGARDQGLTVWEAPQFLSLDRWLAETWAASWPNEQILHPVQELAQWMACVDADPVAEDLLSTKTIARQLRAADRLVASHHIDLSNAPAWTPEQAAFQRWLPQLNAERQSRGELSSAAIPAAFVERLRQGLIRPPEAVALDFPYAGLLLNPSQRAALQALEQTGTRLQHVAPGATVPASSARIFAAAEAERRACAAQIAKLLGALSDTATLPVLVVATANPDADRAALEDALQTALRLTPAHGAASAWRFERADALTSNPWAAAALDILSSRLWDNRFSTVSRLLLSGAQWQGPQRAAATRLETQLRERCAPRIHLRDFVTHADPGFRDGWEALEQVVRDEPRRATPGDWVEHFGRRLQALADLVGVDQGLKLIGELEAKMAERHAKELSYTPEPAEKALMDALESSEPAATRAIDAEDFSGAMAALASLRAPIDRFFDEVTVNADEENKRAHRLDLLARFRAAVHQVADFSRIEG